MRICFVTDFYPPHVGGIEVYAQKLAEAIAAKGDECVIITLRTEKKSPRIEEKGRIKIIRIGAPPFANRFFFSIFAAPAVIAYARSCDIIKGVSYAGAIPAFLAAKVLRKRCMRIMCESLGGVWKNLGLNWFSARACLFMERFVTGLPFDRSVASSRYMQNALRISGVPEEKIEFFYGGFDSEIVDTKTDPGGIRKGMGFADDDFLYLAFGRAGLTKGIEFFIDAIPSVIDKVPKAKFLLIISKSGHIKWCRLMNKIKDIPKESYRFIPGLPRAELMGYLRAADCIVIPSLYEGFGVAALEASAAGKRVVATDVGSLPEVIWGKYLLVKPGCADSLAEGCRRAFSDDMEYSHPKLFDWGRTADRYREIYKRVLGVS